MPQTTTETGGPAQVRLPWWTWVAPAVLCHAGTQVSTHFQITVGTAILYLPIPLALVMIQWWGPRVLAGLFLNALLCSHLWGLPGWRQGIVNALMEAAAVALPWLAYRAAKGRCWLPNLRQLLLFASVIALPSAFLDGVVASWFLVLFGSLTPAEFWRGARGEFIGDLLACLAVTAPLLVFLTAPLERRRLSLAQGAESAGLLPRERPPRYPAIEAVAVFGAILALNTVGPFKAYWALNGLFALWAALRFGFGMAALANAWIVALSLFEPAITSGHFREGWSPGDKRFLAYVGLCVACFSALAAGRVISDLLGEMARRRAAQQSLRESEERYRDIIQTAYEGIWIIDDQERTVFVNQRMCEMLGFTPEEIAARSPFDFVDEEWRAVGRSCVERRRQGVSEMYEFKFQRKDGSDLWALVCASPLYGRASRYRGALRMITDITERKRTEGELRESRELFATFMDHLPGHAFIKDAQGVFRYANRHMRELEGAGDWIGKTAYEYKPKEAGVIAAGDRKALADGFYMTYDYVTTPQGDKRHLLVRKFPIRREGKPPLLGGISLDVTELQRVEEERRKLEAQVQQAQKLESLGVLAGGIAHDFNNLLVGILGNADLALMDLSPASPARASIKEIEQSAVRAAELCRQMLAYSGRGKFLIEAVSLNDIVSEMTHLLEISISKKAVLRYNLAKNLPAIEADVTQIRQVIMNLIINASEALEEKSGVVAISTGLMRCDRAYLEMTWLNDQLPDGEYVFLEVADTGCGMDEVTRRRIFDPFFTTKFTGRGLGLAAVLGIVRGHKGAIKVYSEPGRGTTFKVLFPATTAMATPVGAEQPGGPSWRGQGTILVVDDEETVRAVAQRMLERMGFSVLTASDGREAVETFRAHDGVDGGKIACVLLDLTMPHMDGEEAYRELRRIRAGVRVVISSGYGEQEIAQRFAGKGLAGFVQKPYRAEALAKCLRETLDPKST